MWQCLTPFLACGSLVFRSEKFLLKWADRVRLTLEKLYSWKSFFSFLKFAVATRKMAWCVTNLWSYQLSKSPMRGWLHGSTVRRQYVQPSPTESHRVAAFPATARTALTALGRGTSRSAKSGKRGKTLPGLAGGTDWGHFLSQVGPALAIS